MAGSGPAGWGGQMRDGGMRALEKRVWKKEEG